MYKVLLIDDEPWNLIEIQESVDWNALGYVVCGTADNSDLALRRIHQLHPDLIISDIRMPGMSGLELIAHLREYKNRARVLFISGYSEFQYAQEAIKLQCDGYLLKPVDSEELEAYLNRISKKLSAEQNGQREEQTENLYPSQNRMVRETMDYIQKNYQDNPSLQEMADRFHVSATYLSHLVKEKTGTNFIKHVTALRIQKAQDLLLHTNHSISSIAKEVGYPDYSYFMRMFRQTTGMTPAEFRKKL